MMFQKEFINHFDIDTFIIKKNFLHSMSTTTSFKSILGLTTLNPKYKYTSNKVNSTTSLLRRKTPLLSTHLLTNSFKGLYLSS